MYLPSEFRERLNLLKVCRPDAFDREQVVDAALNYLFMHTVNQRLVNQGLERYRPLVKFNRNLIWISMGCDVMIIGLMSLPNSFVYMAFHPVAYLIK